MKRLLVFALFAFFLMGCSTKMATTSKTTCAGENPDKFCQVEQPPDPLLLGTWECNFVRYQGTSQADSNYLKYRLIQCGDKYALHFHRIWRGGRKKVTEWKGWTINGKDISGEPKFGVRIFVQDNEVYFTIRGLKHPARMTQVES